MSTVYVSAAHAHERGRGSGRRGPAGPLWVAALCVVGLALTWAVAELVPAAHYRDALALYRFTLLGGPRVDELCEDLLRLLEPALYTVWASALVAVAFARRRLRLALAVALVLALAPGIAELLKPLLAHQHASVGGASVGAASWPSGHVTAATVLAMCAVLVVPARLRAAAVAGGLLLMAAVGFAVLVLAWHMPSDVLGGYLLGGLCAALALAWVRVTDARSRGRYRPL